MPDSPLLNITVSYQHLIHIILRSGSQYIGLGKRPCPIVRIEAILYFKLLWTGTRRHIQQVMRYFGATLLVLFITVLAWELRGHYLFFWQYSQVLSVFTCVYVLVEWSGISALGGLTRAYSGLYAEVTPYTKYKTLRSKDGIHEIRSHQSIKKPT